MPRDGDDIRRDLDNVVPWTPPDDDAPEPPPPTGDAVDGEQAPLQATPLGDLDITSIPPRRWILGHRYLRENLTCTIAPGGVGKSTLTLQEAVAIVTGHELTGMPVYETGPVWVFNGEDPADELKRRIGAICQGFGVDVSELRDQLFLDTGAARPLIVAREIEGAVVATPDVPAIKAEIQRHGISTLIVDPFIKAHAVNENANEALDFVARKFSEIAWETGCAINLVHHTRKPPGASSEGMAGNADSGRGASALKDAVRIASTLFGMTEKEADKYGVDDQERASLFRLDDAKANMSPMAARPWWFRREGVESPNGDRVGIARPVDMAHAERLAEEDAEAERERIQDAVVRAVGVGGERTVNQLVGDLAQDALANVGKRTARKRIEDAIPMFPSYADVDVDETTVRVMRAKSGPKNTSPIAVKAWIAPTDE